MQISKSPIISGYVYKVIMMLSVICIRLRIVVSNTYCLVFLFCLSSSCVLCTQCCQFLWIVQFLLPLRYLLAFIYHIRPTSWVGFSNANSLKQRTTRRSTRTYYPDSESTTISHSSLMYFVEKQKSQFYSLGKTKRVHPQPTGSNTYMYLIKSLVFRTHDLLHSKRAR